MFIPNHVTYIFTLLLIPAIYSTPLADEAHSRPSLKYGQRLKVVYDTTVTKHRLYIFPYKAKEKREIQGQFLAFQNDSIGVAAIGHKCNTQWVPLDSTRKIFIHSGRKRATENGFIGGFFIGAFFAIGIPAGDVDRNSIDANVQVWTLEDAAICLGSCVLIGTIIGWFCRADRWSEVARDDWPDKIQLGLMGSGNAVGLVYRF